MTKTNRGKKRRKQTTLDGLVFFKRYKTNEAGVSSTRTDLSQVNTSSSKNDNVKNLENFQRQKDSIVQANMEAKDCKEVEIREGFEEENSEKDIETIIIESSQESADDISDSSSLITSGLSETNNEMCETSDTNIELSRMSDTTIMEVPKISVTRVEVPVISDIPGTAHRTLDIPGMDDTHTKISATVKPVQDLENRDIYILKKNYGEGEMTEEDVVTPGEEGISLFVHPKTNVGDKIVLDENALINFLQILWWYLERHETQERPKATVEELKECLKEITVWKMKFKDGEISMQESSDKCMEDKEVRECHKQVEIFITDKDAKLFREYVERRRESLDRNVETLEDKDELFNELKTATEEETLVEMKGETGEKDENNLEILQRNEEIDQNDEQIRECVERRRETLEDKDELCNELKTATEEDKLVEVKGQRGEKDENNLEILQRNEAIDQNDEQIRECVERQRETLEDKDELCNELKTAREEDKLVEVKGESGKKDENNLQTLQRNEEIDQNDQQIRECVERRRETLEDKDELLSNELKTATEEDKLVEVKGQRGEKDESNLETLQRNEEIDQNDEQIRTNRELPQNTENNSQAVRLGEDFDTLLRAPDCCSAEEVLAPSPSHTILFVPYKPSEPYPRAYRDRWDNNHVKMPCSPQNRYPVTIGDKTLVNRWDLICHAFEKPMTTSYDLEKAIRSYNYCNDLNLKLLHILLLENIPPEKYKEFIDFTLPGIIQAALSLPQVCTQPLPFLKQQREHTITMTQQQAACLLACAFLCMFPRRNPGPKRYKSNENLDFPHVNFMRLFELEENHRPCYKKMEKLKCIIHYFNRILQTPPSGTISFKRQVLKENETPRWDKDYRKLCRLRVTSDGTIEDDAPGLLQVDFANSMVGGGVIGKGCVQEEIRFVICPELIVARLFTERLEDNECLIVTGPERFSNYIGYASSFRWCANHVDKTPRDSWGRLHTVVVAIDAKPHVNYEKQISPKNVKRELEKAYVGFLSRKTAVEHLPAVATGKWGCGAFNGDPQLKSMIQIMAATAAGRDVFYLAFNDKEHTKELHAMHALLRDRSVSIGHLWQMICAFRKKLSSDFSTPLDLFGHFRQELVAKQDNSNTR